MSGRCSPRCARSSASTRTRSRPITGPVSRTRSEPNGSAARRLDGVREMRRILLVACLALTSIVSSGQTAVAAPAVSLLRDTQLDPAAVYFVSFDGLVNNESFQQEAIVSFAGYQ